MAEAIEIEFYRFEPYVRAALQECVVEGNENYIMNVDSGQVIIKACVCECLCVCVCVCVYLCV